MSEELEVLRNRLDAIARQLDWWRDYDRAKRDKEGLETVHDTYIIAPPSWPSHGVLKVWSETLDQARAKLSS